MEFSARPFYGAFEEIRPRNLIKEMFKETIKGTKGDSREGEYYLIGNIVVITDGDRLILKSHQSSQSLYLLPTSLLVRSRSVDSSYNEDMKH